MDFEQLDLYLQGRLDELQAASLRDHLVECSACRRQYHECVEACKLGDQLQGALKDQPLDDVAMREELAEDGQPIDGYRLLREIHRGGQGVVYEAFQTATRRRVAIKVLLEGAFASPAAKQRFEREIELAANLHHRHIVTIHDSGIARGHYYLVMDLVEGERLDHYSVRPELSVRAKVEIFVKVCDAVGFAHQRGVIHRDLKPSNILVDEEGEPFVLDFGLARRLNETGETSYSAEGALLGTPQYMAPEQAEGRVREVDARTDVYALGLILYKMLTGSHPYPVTGRIGEVLNNIVEAQPVRPTVMRRYLDSDLEVIVLKSLAKEPEHRYQSVAELQRDLEFWLQGMPIVARSLSSIYVLSKLIKRHRYTSSVVGLLFVSAFGMGLFSFDMYREAKAAWRESDRLQKMLATEATDHHSTSQAAVFKTILDYWRAGRLQEANLLAVSLDGASREGMAARFLLHGAPGTENSLRHALGPSQSAFAEFVLGEFHLKQGRRAQALACFQKSGALLPANNGDPWLKFQVQRHLLDMQSSSRERPNEKPIVKKS